MTTPDILFSNVSRTDYLGFWPNNKFEPWLVTKFLDLDRKEVAKVANVAIASVRFDEKMPKTVIERIEQIANICALVAEFFGGDVAKTALWFKTKNPLFGNISARDMIRYGRYEKLRRFVVDALQANSASPPNMPRGLARGTPAPI